MIFTRENYDFKETGGVNTALELCAQEICALALAPHACHDFQAHEPVCRSSRAQPFPRSFLA